MNFDHFFNLAGVVALLVGICILTVGSLTLISNLLAQMCEKEKRSGRLKYNDEESDDLRNKMTEYRGTLQFCISFLLPAFFFVAYIFTIFTIDTNSNIIINNNVTPEFAENLLWFLREWAPLEVVYAFVIIYICVIVWQAINFYGKVAETRNPSVNINIVH